jgi:cvfA/B/C family virulence factor
MPRRGNRGNELVVISWRDIPAQVNGRSGDEKHQMVLPRRFQRAIDEAAMVADKKTASEYVGEWRRASFEIPPGEEGMHAAAVREARRLDLAFPRERLQQLVANGGWDPDVIDRP